MARVSNRGAIPGAHLIEPAVLSRIGNLSLLARSVVDGFINGLHRSPYLGFSTDFAEHRSYMPGDDIRGIDWKLYARTDRFYIKQFEAETNSNFMVLLDVSASMGFKTGELSKLDYARYLAACLAYFSRQQGDRVGIATFDRDIVEYVPPASRHLDLVLHTLDRAEAKGRGSLAQPLAKLAANLGRRGILLVISDFYEVPEDAARAIRQLKTRGHDVIVFQLLDAAELEFPYDEATSFEDLETGEQIPVVPDQLRDGYREMMDAHGEELRSLFAGAGIDYRRVDTSKPLGHALFSYLVAREHRSRVR